MLCDLRAATAPLMANIDQIATAFVQHYYTLFDTNRAGLAPLYVRA